MRLWPQRWTKLLNWQDTEIECNIEYHFCLTSDQQAKPHTTDEHYYIVAIKCPRLWFPSWISNFYTKFSIRVFLTSSLHIEKTAKPLFHEGSQDGCFYYTYYINLIKLSHGGFCWWELMSNTASEIDNSSGQATLYSNCLKCLNNVRNRSVKKNNRWHIASTHNYLSLSTTPLRSSALGNTGVGAQNLVNYWRYLPCFMRWGWVGRSHAWNQGRKRNEYWEGSLQLSWLSSHYSSE